MSTPGERANERRRKDERNTRILQMYRDGANYPMLARQFGISRQRASKIVQNELKAAAALRREMADNIIDLSLERLEGVWRQAWMLVLAPCPDCQGQGTFQNSEVCDRCHGEGKRYPPDIRLKAMREARASADQRDRLLGNYAPDKIAYTDSKGNDVWTRVAEEMSDDEIHKALKDLETGIDIGRRMAEPTQQPSGS